MIGRMFVAACMVLAACASAGVAAAADPGVDPGRPFDLQRFIDGELAAGKRRIVVPPGRHRVGPAVFSRDRAVGRAPASVHVAGGADQPARMHLLLAGLDGVEIVAAGAELICTEPTRAITFADCRNVTLSGLTIDYDPLPFTQGRITGLSADGLVHEIDLFADYPAAGGGDAWKYEIFVPETGLLRFGSYYDFTIERLGGRALRLTKTGPSRAGPGTERVGDIVAIAFVDWASGLLPHAVGLHACTDVRLEDVTLHAANCFGFFESDCDGSTYRRCRVDRRPAATDLRPRAVRRMRSLNADAFHSKHAMRGPRYLDCVARFMGDDCVAINGDQYLVTSCTAGTARVLAKEGMRIREGGTVEVTTAAGRHATTPRVLRVAPAGAITAVEQDYVRSLPIDGRMRRHVGGMLATAYDVTLDEPLGLPRGSVLAPTDALGHGFVIEGCDFGWNRSRGAIVKAGRGRIVGNRFTDTWMEAIKLAPEYYWLEAGWSDDVIVEANAIARCHDTAIRVAGGLGSDRPLPAGAHRRITIQGNRLVDCAAPRIHVTSTDGLTIRDNTVACTTVACDTGGQPDGPILLVEHSDHVDRQ
ncbi:MAG: right-handed parallel beta-helix repeat-containing protein, partial [Planctomycetia bacterium]|nr:right-handed parallel beta-helix repeat-containing protein [Planctomycetia bacterium]